MNATSVAAISLGSSELSSSLSTGIRTAWGAELMKRVSCCSSYSVCRCWMRICWPKERMTSYHFFARNHSLSLMQGLTRLGPLTQIGQYEDNYGHNCQCIFSTKRLQSSRMVDGRARYNFFYMYKIWTVFQFSLLISSSLSNQSQYQLAPQVMTYHLGVLTVWSFVSLHSISSQPIKPLHSCIGHLEVGTSCFSQFFLAWVSTPKILQQSFVFAATHLLFFLSSSPLSLAKKTKQNATLENVPTDKQREPKVQKCIAPFSVCVGNISTKVGPI